MPIGNGPWNSGELTENMQKWNTENSTIALNRTDDTYAW